MPNFILIEIKIFLEEAMKLFETWLNKHKINYKSIFQKKKEVIKKGINVPKNIKSKNLKNCCNSKAKKFCFNQVKNKIYNIENRKYTKKQCKKKYKRVF